MISVTSAIAAATDPPNLERLILVDPRKQDPPNHRALSATDPKIWSAALLRLFTQRGNTLIYSVTVVSANLENHSNDHTMQ